MGLDDAAMRTDSASRPPFPFEPGPDRDGDYHHEAQHVELAVWPGEFRHVLEVHAVEARHERQREHDCRDEREALHRLVHAVRLDAEIRVDRVLHDVAVRRDLLRHAREVIKNVAKVWARVLRDRGEVVSREAVEDVALGGRYAAERLDGSLEREQIRKQIALATGVTVGDDQVLELVAASLDRFDERKKAVDHDIHEGVRNPRRALLKEVRAGFEARAQPLVGRTLAVLRDDEGAPDDEVHDADIRAQGILDAAQAMNDDVDVVVVLVDLRRRSLAKDVLDDERVVFARSSSPSALRSPRSTHMVRPARARSGSRLARACGGRYRRRGCAPPSLEGRTRENRTLVCGPPAGSLGVTSAPLATLATLGAYRSQRRPAPDFPGRDAAPAPRSPARTEWSAPQGPLPAR